MSFLDRLKNVFSGGEEPEKKDKAAKSETEKPPVEKETKTQEKVHFNIATRCNCRICRKHGIRVSFHLYSTIA